ncbi:MAG: hypothetical protein GF353_04650 [Candidatus Lokiarchaeota archaeon]|nr:hypothetical protein [Candidatus Lokiarchaeota archaeon]
MFPQNESKIESDRKKYRSIKIICPKCNNSKWIKVPSQILKQSEHLTTISIPGGLNCEHSFQIFVDKEFNIRAYQLCDFEISKMEFYEGGPESLKAEKTSLKEDYINYNLSVFIRDVVDLIRTAFNEKSILGGALFTSEGRMLYSSLPDKAYFQITREKHLQETQENEHLKNKIFIFNNDDTLILEYLRKEQFSLVLIVFFSNSIEIPETLTYFQKIKFRILDLYDTRLNSGKKPGKYWIYSKITRKSLLKDLDNIKLETIDLHLSRSVILNLKEILLGLKKQELFEGKIYISERYVKLMEGMNGMLKDATLFMNKLNKFP